MNFEKYIPDPEIRKKTEAVYNDIMFPLMVSALSPNDRIVILEYLKNILDMDDFKELVELFLANKYSEETSKQFKLAFKYIPLPKEILENEKFKELKDKLDFLK